MVSKKIELDAFKDTSHLSDSREEGNPCGRIRKVGTIVCEMTPRETHRGTDA